MKIKSDHFATLKEEIAKTATKHADTIAKYPKEHLQTMRFRWDLFWAARLSISDGKGIRPIPGRVDIPLYSYMDDTHIDTALRKIVEELFPA